MNAYTAYLEYNHQVFQHRIALAFNVWMRSGSVGVAVL